MEHFPAGQKVNHFPVTDDSFIIYKRLIELLIMAHVQLAQFHHGKLYLHCAVLIHDFTGGTYNLIIVVQHIFLKGDDTLLILSAGTGQAGGILPKG